MKRKRKGGFTLVEIVISIAIVAAICLTATTIYCTAIGGSQKSTRNFYAVRHMSNLFELYRACEEDPDAPSSLLHAVNAYYYGGEEGAEMTEDEGRATVTLFFKKDWSLSEKADAEYLVKAEIRTETAHGVTTVTFESYCIHSGGAFVSRPQNTYTVTRIEVTP